MAANDAKDTIYVDVDDEITGIIDKVRSSGGKVVALVLPKRATVLQSIVNMKLLKRTAENAKKHLVLITTEASLLPLAGSVGLHVASTPTSKPVVPAVPEGPGDEPEDVDEPLAVNDGTDDSGYDPSADGNRPVGELAAVGLAGAAASKLKPAIDEEIEMDSDGEPADSSAEGDAKTAKAAKPKKNRKLLVPNFDSFRNKLLLAGGILVLLIVGWFVAFKVLPKATITIHTDTTTVPTNVNLTLDTTVKTLDTTQNIVPATSQAIDKSYTQQVASTGQINNGDKADGNVYFALKDCSVLTVTIPAGTGVSSGGNTYITQAEVDLQSAKIGSTCNPNSLQSYWSSTVKVVAVAGGTKYNLSSGTVFSIPSSISGASSVSAKANTDIDGGTDNVTKVVAQADIDSAKSKISTQDTTAVKTGLQASLQGKSLTAVTTTFLAGDPIVTTSAKAGDPADTVTVTEVINYSMLGVKQADLQTIVVTNVNKQIDKSKQVILDDGVATAKFTQANPGTPTNAVVAFSATSVAGPDIDTDKVRSQVAGMKSGDITSMLEQTPGVTSVDISYSPFWVHSVPTNEKKITVQLDKANTGKQ